MMQTAQTTPIPNTMATNTAGRMACHGVPPDPPWEETEAEEGGEESKGGEEGEEGGEEEEWLLGLVVPSGGVVSVEGQSNAE